MAFGLCVTALLAADVRHQQNDDNDKDDRKDNGYQQQSLVDVLSVGVRSSVTPKLCRLTHCIASGSAVRCCAIVTTHARRTTLAAACCARAAALHLELADTACPTGKAAGAACLVGIRARAARAAGRGRVCVVVDAANRTGKGCAPAGSQPARRQEETTPRAGLTGCQAGAVMVHLTVGARLAGCDRGRCNEL